MTGRVTFVISSLMAGGAERVASIMANYWAQIGRDVTILTFNDESTPSFYDLDPRIKYVPLSLACASRNPVEGLINNIKRIYVLRREIRKRNPDAIISFMDMTNVLTLLAAMGLKIPIIVSEHVDPGMVDIGVLWEKLRNLIYPMADKIALLNERMETYYPDKIRQKTIVIPNPVLAPAKENDEQAQALFDRPCIVAMGRLSYEKGFDILLSVFARVREKHPSWSMTILGEGPLRGDLEALRDELGLTAKVHMPGVVRNPNDYLRQADLFVLSSRNEAFPMALCEAMACGAPVVSFDCDSGPKEIIRDGVDGVLVPSGDVGSLADVMSRLMGDESERKRLAASAPDIVERFGVRKIMKMWENILGGDVSADGRGR